ncbi:MAG: hypothetical protein CMJ89_18260 [Planctomycetes bacterium]|jgi:hypothetical protein|nr:hypothetical protein [Planctomycetota bacterium]
MPRFTLSHDPSPRLSLAASLAVLLSLAGCGTGEKAGGQSQPVGAEFCNPATGMPFIVDENQSGQALSLRIAEIFWGRRVNVHQLAANFDPDPKDPAIPQAVDPDPVFVDFVINQNILTDNVNWILEANPITQVTRLIILARRDAVEPSATCPEGNPDVAERLRFEARLRLTQQNFPFVLPKNDDGSSPTPFSFIPRNACMVIRFNDCLDDDVTPFGELADTVKVFNGIPPTSPFDSRILFDPNHGGLVNGVFRPTRVLISATVSVDEAALMGGVAPNALGFSSSLNSAGQPSVSVRIPTQTAPSATQFEVLRNLRGNPLDFDSGGPRDFGSPTRDIVRALRSGSADDVHNGFLRDETTPDLLGFFQSTVSSPINPSMDRLTWILSLGFDTACTKVPDQGDVIRVNGVVLEVTVMANDVPPGGPYTVNCRASVEVPSGVDLTGDAQFITAYDPLLVMGAVTPACWVGFSPAPVTPPALGVGPGAQATLRFSEPMDPDTLSPFSGFMIVGGAGPSNDEPPEADKIVVSPLLRSPGLDQFFLDPIQPLSHINPQAETYHIRLRGATDLAGNALDSQLPFVNFVLDSTAPTALSGGISFRFDSTDEMGDTGPDIRGQVIYQFGTNGGRIVPRQPVFASYVADRNQPVPMQQTASPLGVQDPLRPLGSKLQYVWRYADFGWKATDETKYDLDIVGLNWAPLGGLADSDFFESFEMRLAHSLFLPDDGILPAGPPPAPSNGNILITGLPPGPCPFENNVLADPRSPQLLVHPSSLGYRIEPANLFVTPSNTVMMPYPYDPFSNIGVGGIPETFTWRDTSVQALGGPFGVGIPQFVEIADAGIVYPNPDDPSLPNLAPGEIARTNQVPSYGLPLLVEVRCFPSNNGLGLNTLDVSLGALPLATVLSGINGGPAFRAYTSGGVGNTGTPQSINPNLEPFPRGGLNPNSLPPNMPSLFSADNQWYLGQIDTVIRVSRAHSIWLKPVSSVHPDNGPADYRLPILLPSPDSFPEGTSVVLEYRGAEPITDAGQLAAAQNADNLDAYGDIAPGQAQVIFLDGDDTWKTAISEIDGAALFQIRFTFINNIVKGVTADLDAVGISFTL